MITSSLRSWRRVMAALALIAIGFGCSSTNIVEGSRPLEPGTGADAAATAESTEAAVDTAPVFMPTPTIEAEPTAPATATAAPEPSSTPTPEPTPQPDGPCGVGPLALSNPDRPVYTGSISVDPGTRTMTGDLSVLFTPDLATDDLYVRLWPNGPRSGQAGVMMTVDSVLVDGIPVVPESPDPTIVRVPLSQPLDAGESVRLDVTFELVVPVELNSRISARDDYMRLGTALPILPWEPGRGWALEAPTSLFAEAVSSPVADYTVRVRVPEGYGVLASGTVDDEGVWTVESARDFALTVGRFRTEVGVAMAPEPVQVTVGVHETIADDPGEYLAKIIDSLEQFSSRWGQYPWPSLTFAVTPALSGGIEFPTHIMQGPGTQGRVTSHEVGHMFFYSLVGNNQGTEPWLDEGLTSYAEFTYEGTVANAFPIPEGGVGNATEPMSFWEARADLYYRSVYAQTGFALQQLGSQADVDCALARYVAANAHSIATADDFVEAFLPTFPDVVARLAELGVGIG